MERPSWPSPDGRMEPAGSRFLGWEGAGAGVETISEENMSG